MKEIKFDCFENQSSTSKIDLILKFDEIKELLLLDRAKMTITFEGEASGALITEGKGLVIFFDIDNEEEKEKEETKQKNSLNLLTAVREVNESYEVLRHFSGFKNVEIIGDSFGADEKITDIKIKLFSDHLTETEKIKELKKIDGVIVTSEPEPIENISSLDNEAPF